MNGRRRAERYEGGRIPEGRGWNECMGVRGRKKRENKKGGEEKRGGARPKDGPDPGLWPNPFGLANGGHRANRIWTS